MKRLLCALVLLWAGVILPSCQKAPALTLTGGALVEIGSDGRSESLTFTANRNWTVEWTENWIHVSPSSGSAADGPITVSVSCDANTAYEDRSGTVTIRLEELSQTVSVRQHQKDDILLDESSYEILGKGGFLTVSLQSNVEPEVIPQADWIHFQGYTETKGMSGGTITLLVDANGWETVREGLVKIRGKEGSVPETSFTIRQYISTDVFKIPAANLEVNDERLANKTSGRDNFRETGVYKAWAMILEMIANGTRIQDAATLRKNLRRNRPLICDEQPSATFADLDMCEFPEPAPPGSEYEWEPEPDHGETMTRNMLAVLYPVLKGLGIKIGFIGEYNVKDISKIDESEEGNIYQVLKHTRKYPGLNFYYSYSREYGWDRSDEGNIHWRYSYTALRQVLEQPNLACYMGSFANVGLAIDPTARFKQKVEDFGSWEELCEKWYMQNLWSFGADGVMGGDNYGVSHCIDEEGPKYMVSSFMPVASRRDDDKVWCETSRLLTESTEATSPAAPTATGKFFLGTLLNQCNDPDISLAESRKRIRAACLPHIVYQGSEYYMTGKRLNPGALVGQFFSSTPETVSLSSETLLPLTASVFKGSIFVGPGVVDADGTPVAEQNYSSMWGKTLYLSPVRRRDYGFKEGDTLELTEYLCLDGQASGTGVTADACKYIDKRISHNTIH